MLRRFATLIATIAVLAMGTAVPALATVQGPCDGNGKWSTGEDVTASQLQPGEVVEIPRAATVTYTGEVRLNPPPTEPRPVSGWIKVELPWPINEVTVGSWPDTGTSTGKTGTYTYDLPAILAGFEVPVSGKHWEGDMEFSGPPTCSGKVTLKLAGTNPAGFITAGLTVISIAGVYLSVRARGPSAGGGTRS
jgi:hypothetical protein